MRKVSLCGENRKGCDEFPLSVFGYSRSWLPVLTASLASAGWLLCPSPCSANTLTHRQPLCVNFVPSQNKGTTPYLSSLSPTWTTRPCIVQGRGTVSCLRRHQRYTSFLFFPGDFSSKVPEVLFISQRLYLQGTSALGDGLFDLEIQQETRALEKENNWNSWCWFNGCKFNMGCWRCGLRWKDK